MSLEELIVTLDAIKRREEREFRFHAAIQGIEYGDGKSEADASFEDIWSQEVKGVKDLPEPERLQARGIQYEELDG